jgi:2-iminobutanoate/2-iminopropanoate deaminase
MTGHDGDYVEGGGFVFIAAQSGLTAGAGSSVEEQTEACLGRIEQILQSIGSSVDRLVKVQVFLADMGQKDGLYNPTYNEFFHSRGVLQKPARSTVGVALSPGELVRMDAIAHA